jgi:hypothetical protein
VSLEYSSACSLIYRLDAGQFRRAILSLLEDAGDVRFNTTIIIRLRLKRLVAADRRSGSPGRVFSSLPVDGPGFICHGLSHL